MSAAGCDHIDDRVVFRWIPGKDKPAQTSGGLCMECAKAFNVALCRFNYAAETLTIVTEGEAFP